MCEEATDLSTYCRAFVLCLYLKGILWTWLVLLRFTHLINCSRGKKVQVILQNFSHALTGMGADYFVVDIFKLLPEKGINVLNVFWKKWWPQDWISCIFSIWILLSNTFGNMKMLELLKFLASLTFLPLKTRTIHKFFQVDMEHLNFSQLYSKAYGGVDCSHTSNRIFILTV